MGTLLINKGKIDFRVLSLNFALILLIAQTAFSSRSVTAAHDQHDQDVNNTTDISDVDSADGRQIDMADVNSVCGRRLWKEPGGRIVGGNKAKFADWPWMVVFLEEYMPGEYANTCGASLLNEHWVVTAAHCVYNKKVNMKVRLGELDLLRDDILPYKDIGVKKVVIHDKYDHKKYFNDIALLKLKKPVKFEQHILPICLPNDDDDIDGKTATATGWGSTKPKGRGAAILHQVDLPILTNSDCQRMYRKAGIYRNFPYTVVCAGRERGGVDACQGDSGGPLVVYNKRKRRYVLVGVTSMGAGCGAANKPGIYTRVSAFKSWINKVISQY